MDLLDNSLSVQKLSGETLGTTDADLPAWLRYSGAMVSHLGAQLIPNSAIPPVPVNKAPSAEVKSSSSGQEADTDGGHSPATNVMGDVPSTSHQSLQVDLPEAVETARRQPAGILPEPATPILRNDAFDAAGSAPAVSDRSVRMNSTQPGSFKDTEDFQIAVGQLPAGTSPAFSRSRDIGAGQMMLPQPAPTGSSAEWNPGTGSDNAAPFTSELPAGRIPGCVMDQSRAAVPVETSQDAESPTPEGAPAKPRGASADRAGRPTAHQKGRPQPVFNDLQNSIFMNTSVLADRQTIESAADSVPETITPRQIDPGLENGGRAVVSGPGEEDVAAGRRAAERPERDDGKNRDVPAELTLALKVRTKLPAALATARAVGRVTVADKLVATDTRAPQAPPAQLIAVPDSRPATLSTGGERYQRPAQASAPLTEPVEVRLRQTPEKPIMPLKRLDLEINRPGDERLQLRVLDRAGELHVAVRAGDSDLSTTLQEGLPALMERLEQTGYRAEAWRPTLTGVAQNAEKSPGPASPQAGDNSSNSQGWAQSDRGGQEQGSRDRPQWVEELEDSTKERRWKGVNHGEQR